MGKMRIEVMIIKMFKLLLYLLLVLSAMTSCKNFFVPNSRLILEDEGYFIFTRKDYPRFFPSDIDTSLSVAENLKAKQVKPGLYLHSMLLRDERLLKWFSDTSNGTYIVRGKLEYVMTKSIKPFRKGEKKYTLSRFEFQGKEYLVKLRGRVSVYPISTRPCVKLARGVYVTWMLNGDFDEFLIDFMIKDWLKVR